jgi:phage gpG-like protein
MIRAYLVGDDQVIAKLNRIYPAVHERLRIAITRLALQLVRHVVADKLSGQVLGKYTHWKATNRLRNSINPGTLQESGTAISQSVGSNVEYAAFWEYGYTGQISVSAHPRTITQAFGRPLKSPVVQNVRAYSRKVNIAPRSFLRSALADMTEEIKVGLNNAVAEGVKAA